MVSGKPVFNRGEDCKHNMGRHRAFDADSALLAALHVFWRNGFEGASLSDLTEAMGITRPSLYATYGNKEALFHKALDKYEALYLSFFARALEAGSARDVVSQVLTGFADLQAPQDHPPGCMDTNCALVCSEAAEPIRRELIRRRKMDEDRLCERLERARAEGDLPSSACPATLARFVMTVAQGMSVQAASGVDHAGLRQIVQTALQAFPAHS
ncbi:Transcriptional regulator, TetR family [Granulibacter bethesdensis]|uniref:Transcriptional regulator, TetR family n=2 Tax=Granulibacter bethesdensis TaxID=364410 RepID=A0AAN0VG26_9PROT|nr:Transcriptional regulator, TetR family [Granulibacter bethesdensis]APH59882.1 Transcriptional regulator, TetR family [Granulibacter bethesdensis]